jgi:alkylation response protein AidB-like acyl-CoA dehydrogenase
MDFSYNEEQELLRRTAREFLTTYCSPAVVQQLEESDLGYSPELVSQVAGFGWFGLGIPEAYGGVGGFLLHLIALYEEIGRALFPSPHFSTVVLSAPLLVAAGSEQQKQHWLPEVAEGQALLTLAFREPDYTYDPLPAQTTARHQGKEIILNGHKMFVHNAHTADELMVTAHLDGQVALVLVPRTAPGVTIRPLETVAGDRQFETELVDVRVAADALVGEPGTVTETILKDVLNRAAMVACAQMVGGAQRVLEMTVAYAKDRVQFGRPIGAFQHVQARCVNILAAVETSRLMTYYAAWKVEQGRDAEIDVASAMAWTTKSYRDAVTEAHEVHAGIGYTMDYPLQLYTRRAKSLETLFGDFDYFCAKVGQLI